MNQEKPAVVIGIDVSKARLDICAPGGEWSVHNDLESIGILASQLQELQPDLIVIESTGGLERAVLVELSAVGLPVA